MKSKLLVFVDQASSSAGNFLLVAGAAHAMELPLFGRFALGYAAMQFGMEMSRALVAEPVQLLEADRDDGGFSAWRTGLQSVAVGCVIALLVAVAVVVAELSVADGGFLLASLPMIAWFEGLRHRSLVTGNEGRAACANLVWLGLVVLIVAVPAVADEAFRTAGTAVFAWALAAMVASACYLGLSTGHLGVSLWEVCSRGRRFAIETLADRGLIFVGLGIGSVVVGSAGFGEVSAGRAVFAATNVAVSALLLIMVTHFIAGRRQPPGSQPRFWTAHAGLRIAVAALPLALFSFDEATGNQVSQLLLGEREPSTVFLISAAMFFTGVAASVGPRAWVRAQLQDDLAVRLRAANGCLVAVSGVVGAVAFDAQGLAAGLGLGALLGAASWHWGASRVAV